LVAAQIASFAAGSSFPGGGARPAVGPKAFGDRMGDLLSMAGMGGDPLSSISQASGQREVTVADSGYRYVDELMVSKVIMPLGDEVSSRDIEFEVKRSVLTLGKRGDDPLSIDHEEHWDSVVADDCYWEIDEVGSERCVVLELRKKTPARWDYLLASQYTPPDTTVTDKVFLDVKIGDAEARRVTLGLYGAQTPKTAENFRALCTGEKGEGEAGAPLHYKGSTFHRVIPGFMLQGGDFTNGDGTGGESIYGAKFKDENFELTHMGEGILSMANAGPNTNGSQFFITYKAAAHLNNKYTVFARVIHGMEMLDAAEKEPVGAKDVPLNPITISKVTIHANPLS